MKQIRERIEQMLATPGQELGRFTRFIVSQVELWRFCARRLHQNNVEAMSAALSFRTIFAMIPVLAMALLAMKTVGALEDSRQSLRRFLEASGFAQIATVHGSETQPAGTTATAPTTGKVINVAERIEEAFAEVNSKLTFERIGPIGGALLIWTALTLLTTMEQSLNRIFEARSDRPIVRRVLLYWSTMTLGPIALAAASYLGNRAMDTVRGAPGSSWVLLAVGWAGPIVIGIIVLSLVYALLPNTNVRFEAALGGAVVAVPLWLVAKWAFSLYVRHLVVKGNLYGMLGVLPLFLMWLSLSWWIFLFGAQLAHTAANLTRMRLAEQAGRIVLGPSDLVGAALALARNYQTGLGSMTRDEMAATLNLPSSSVQWLIDRLNASELLINANRKTDAAFLLCKPPGQITLIEVVRAGDPRSAQATSADDTISKAVAQFQSRANSSLEGLTLADLLADGAKPRA
jgi:membrane protein